MIGLANQYNARSRRVAHQLANAPRLLQPETPIGWRRNMHHFNWPLIARQCAHHISGGCRVSFLSHAYDRRLFDGGAPPQNNDERDIEDRKLVSRTAIARLHEA